MSEKWGVGNRKDEKAFATVKVGDEDVELIHGEHPHSRADNKIYARFKDGSVEGFDGHMMLVGFRYEPSNYLKTSGLSGNEVRKGGQFVVTVNGRDIYSRFCRSAERAAGMFFELEPKLFEGPIDWRDPEGWLIDRKIYYQNVPAVITRWLADEGDVIIEAEPGYTFPQQPWHDDFPPDDETSVTDDILSPHIWWFRTDKEEKG